MRVALLGPDLFSAFHDFARALNEAGARVVGVGATPRHRLRAGLVRHLERWIEVPNPLEGKAVAAAIRRALRGRELDRLETVEERLVVAAADARALLRLPGLSPEAARLCRDKVKMKEAWRRAGIPCAQSALVRTEAELASFTEQVGFPVIVKPRAGLGSQKTFRLERAGDLSKVASLFRLGSGGEAAVEEYIEGHEGFYDTITIAGAPAFEFVSHYYPSVLEALSNRSIAPQIAATNRLEAPGYRELFEAGRKAIAALGITDSATHMEWFFGPKGLKVSEIGARPPGERLWDLYCQGNDLDLYRSWAEAIVSGRKLGSLSRRFAAGSVQVRPDRDGRIAGYRGLERVLKKYGDLIFAKEIPPPGRKTVPIEKGYLANLWLRLKHPDYDELRKTLDEIGRTVKVLALPG